MVAVPTKRTQTVTRHEWVIGKESEHTSAKDFTFGINHAAKAMADLGVDMEFDDCYMVRAGDGGEIILYVEIDEDA